MRKSLADVGPRRVVLEIGSRDVNGSVRALFIDAHYVGLDILAGVGVDVVSQPSLYVASHRKTFDCVVCCETLEHDPEPFETIKAARAALVDDGGIFILTTANVNRTPHSAIDGGEVREGEHYRNIGCGELRSWLSASFGRWQFEVDEIGKRDIRALAWTGRRPNDGGVEWRRALSKVNLPPPPPAAVQTP